jgi:hypothetical protein
VSPGELTRIQDDCCELLLGGAAPDWAARGPRPQCEEPENPSAGRKLRMSLRGHIPDQPPGGIRRTLDLRLPFIVLIAVAEALCGGQTRDCNAAPHAVLGMVRNPGRALVGVRLRCDGNRPRGANAFAANAWRQPRRPAHDGSARPLTFQSSCPGRWRAD